MQFSYRNLSTNSYNAPVLIISQLKKTYICLIAADTLCAIYLMTLYKRLINNDIL